MSASSSSDDGSFSRSVLSMITVKLTRDNYSDWLSRIKPALESKKCWKYVERTAAAAVIGAEGRITLHNAHNDALVRPGVSQAEIDAVEKFDSEAAFVVLMLRSSLSEGVSSVAMGYDRPWELFYVIEKHCKPQATSEWQERINKKMREIKMKSSVNAPVLVSRFISVFADYKAAFGMELPDATKSFLFFDALPDSGPWGDWKKVRKNLSNTFADNCTAAMNYELSLTNDGINNVGASDSNSHPSSAILVANGNGNKLKTCFYCHKIGHVTTECRKLKRDKQEKNKSAANANANATPAPKMKCNYCGKTNHTEERCFKKKKDGVSKDQMQLANGTAGFDAWLMVHPIDDSTTAGDVFCLDSGATRHLVSNRSVLHNIRPLSSPIDIKVADGRSIKVVEEGVLHLNTPHGRRSLSNVALCDGAGTNLISVGALTDKGATSTFNNTSGKILDQAGRVLFDSDRVGRSLYVIRCSVINPPQSPIPEQVYSLSDDDLLLWHRRLVHVNNAALHHMHNQGITIGLSTNHHHDKCRVCMQAKMSRIKFGDKLNRHPAQGVFHRVHADLMGPFRVPAIHNRAVYALTIMDEYSNYVWQYYLQNKSDAAGYIKNWHTMIKNQYGISVKEFHSDHGGEFISNELLKYWDDHGVIATTTPRDTPQYNGIVERMHRTILDGTRALLIQSALPRSFWLLAMDTVVYTINRTVRSTKRTMSPSEIVNGIKPILSHMRVFGCDAMVHQKNPAGKLDSKATPMVFVGYVTKRMCYKFFNPVTGTFVIERDANFIEGQFTVGRPSSRSQELIRNAINGDSIDQLLNPDADGARISVSTLDDCLEYDMNPISGGDIQLRSSSYVPPPVLPSSNSSSMVNNNQPSLSSSSSNVPNPIPASLPPRPVSVIPAAAPAALSDSPVIHDAIANGGVDASSSRRSNRLLPSPPPPRELRNLQQWGWFKNKSEGNNDAAHSSVETQEEPSSYEEAIQSSDCAQWKQAMDEEIKSQNDNKTWSVITRASVPDGKRVLSCKWVLKIKRDANGNPVRYKARLCAKGFMQKYGEDYFDTFAPVMSYKTLRLLLTIAAVYDYEIKQIDVVTAFLNAPMNEEVYMELPDGYGSGGNNVVRLLRAIYGTKQAPHSWNDTLDKQMKACGFNRLRSDACVYVKHKIIIGVFVDDFIILYHKSIESLWLSEKAQLFSTFKINDLGDASFILGMRITRDRTRKSILLDQQSYIHRIGGTYGVVSSLNKTTTSTPMDKRPSIKDAPVSDEEKASMNKYPYRAIIGSLMYSALSTRPDIAYAVAALAQLSSNPGMPHWSAACRIVQYLMDTSHYKLRLGGSDSISVQIFSDADWAGQSDHGKSMTGGVVMFCGGTISWSSRRQSSVALSSMESEFIALVSAAADARWIQQLLQEVGMNDKQPIPIFVDNMAVIDYCKNECNSSRTRHFNIKYHFVRDEVAQNHIKLEWVPTENQIADIMTKPLDRPLFLKQMKRLMDTGM